MKPSEVYRALNDPRLVDTSVSEYYVLVVYIKTAPSGEQAAAGFDLIGPMDEPAATDAVLKVVNHLDREFPQVRHSVHSFRGRPLEQSLVINPSYEAWAISTSKRAID